MAMISTRDLGAMPDLRGFRRLTRSLATLDAILSPDWEYRYYSFDAHWGERSMMASMRNGSGDHWFALVRPEGIALHGLAHEATVFRDGDPWPGIFDGLPAELAEGFLDEPAFDTANSTFCVWRRAGDDGWSRGPVELPAGEDPDGSGELLSILDGDPGRYVRFAAEYFEREVQPSDVAAVYRHEPLTEALVRRMNRSAELSALSDDVAGIGYPEAG